MTRARAPAELLSLVMRRLEEPPGLERSEECFRTVALLALLLQRFPGDMAPPFQADALAFFRDSLLPALLRLECALDPALHALHVHSRRACAALQRAPHLRSPAVGMAMQCQAFSGPKREVGSNT